MGVRPMFRKKKHVRSLEAGVLSSLARGGVRCTIWEGSVADAQRAA